MKLRKLNKNKKYLLACSFGPDSMALFNMLLKEGYNFEVAHLNYHLREESNLEEINLTSFCKQNNIKIHVKSINYIKGNVEERARNERYSFFEEIVKKENFDACLIAHNLDDLLETYLLQKERKNYVFFFGLKEVFYRNNVEFIRPLLNHRKEELLNYVKKENVPYSIDKSNFDVKYQRNKYRIEVVSKLNEKEFKEFLKEINLKNKSLKKEQKKCEKFIDSKNRINTKKTLSLSDEEFIKLFYVYLSKQEKFFKSFSKKEIFDLKEKISLKKRFKVVLDDKFYLFFEYNFLYISQIYNNKYCFELDKFGNKYFKFKKGKKYKEIFDKYDKILIHPVSDVEYYTYMGEKKKISHFFKDMKLPSMYRNIYPGVYSNKGEILYLPRYKEDFDHKKISFLDFSFEDLINYE